MGSNTSHTSHTSHTIAPDRWLTRQDHARADVQARVWRLMRLAPPIRTTILPPVASLPRRSRRKVAPPTRLPLHSPVKPAQSWIARLFARP